MASRGTIRKGGEVPTLWLRCGYRGLLLYEDEIRSVEGPGARGRPRRRGTQASHSFALLKQLR